MTPYFHMDGIELYHGDFRFLLSQVQADVVVTDPPYGCNASSGWGGAYSGFQIEGDHSTDARDWLLAAWAGPAIVFGSPRVPRPFGCTTLIWAKGDHTGMGDLSFPWKPDYEEIYVRGSGFSGPRTSSVLQFNARIDSGRMHPTEKPVALMAELIRKCPPGVILDPFTGSGSTLVAARCLGRRAVGVEMEERYCEVAAKRLAQGDMFTASGGG